MQFKKSNQENSYPNPWPDYSGITAIKNALNQDDPAIKSYVVSIDQVPTGLQEGYMQCLFGSDVLSVADDGRTYKAVAQVQGQGQKNAYVCDNAKATVDASQVINGLLQDSDNAYEYEMSVANDESAQASWYSRLWGMLFAATTTYNAGPGADPYNARVALTRYCYQQGAPTALQNAGQNQRMYTYWLEKLQTECVCGGSNKYSTFNYKKLDENIEKQKNEIETNKKAALSKALNTRDDALLALQQNTQLTDTQRAATSNAILQTFNTEYNRINTEATTKTQQAESQRTGPLESTKNILRNGITDLEKKLPQLKGKRKDDLQNQINNLKQVQQRVEAMTEEDAKKTDNSTFLRNTYNSLIQSQAGCFDNCVNKWKSDNNQQGDVPTTVSQQCRASCVAEMCPFERPPYQPVKTTISTPAPPGGNGGGGGTIGGGASSAARVASSTGVSSAAVSSTGGSAGTTGGDTGGTTGGGFTSSARRNFSSVAISSTASVAISGEACITKYVAPAEYAPDPAVQLGDGQQFAYTGQFAIPWNFQDAQGIQKDFNVFLGDVVYQKGAKRFTRGVWSTVSLDGTFSKPVQADVPTIPNDTVFKRSSGLFDGKDTIWNVALQGYPDCKQVNVDGVPRPLCNFEVQKTTISTNTSKKIVIPNSTWYGAMVHDGATGSPSLVASDGSLWFSIIAADVLINVRPDMSVKIIPFPSKGCTSIGRPVYQYGDAYCRGASKLKEGPDGSIWFTTGLQAEAEKYPQIGIVKKDGTVKMIYSPSGWEEIVYVKSFFKGYDGAMWLTYERPNSVGVLAPDYTKHVARMTMEGALSFVQTPAYVVTMAAGKDGMWFVGNIVKGTPAQPAYQPVIGFLGKTTSKLQTLPIDLLRAVGMQSLLVDKDNVPWMRVQNWKNASSASSLPLAQYLEPVTFLPDTQSVIKFVCGSSSSMSSFSSRSSSASSVSSQTQCPANGCALNNNAGDTYCASQGMLCTAADTLPCVKCVPKSSSSSKAPDPRCQQNGCTQLGGNAACEFLDASCRTSTDFPCYVCDFNPVSSRSSSSRTSSRSSFISYSSYSSFSVPPSYSSSYSVPPSSSRSSAGVVSLFVCGNGITDPGEQCDDGNLSDTDLCTTGCTINLTPVAQFSSRPAPVRPSPSRSSSAYVAIGAPRPGFNPMFCGNGRLDLAEDCDLGTQNSDLPNASCRSDCSLTRCGDQVVDGIRGEQCDDGNGIDGDGCSVSCTIEQFAGNPSSVGVLPGSLIELPFAPGTPGQGSVLPNVPAHGPVGDTGPEAIAIMAAGASAGYTWMKMRKMKK